MIFFKYRENYNNYVQMKLKNKIKNNEYYYFSLLIKFFKNRKIEPDIVCVCCENLFFF